MPWIEWATTCTGTGSWWHCSCGAMGNGGRVREPWPQGHVRTTCIVMLLLFLQDTSQVMFCQRYHTV
jgi:hypothetical protein